MTTTKTDSNPSSETPEVATPAYISYADFAKLDIRIGTIVSVESVPDTDKLLQLKVDFGTETRQIISGIREYFDDYTWLNGKQCPFICNLEPRTIRGLESQGMILAADSDNTLGILVPHNHLPPGTAVH